MTERPVVNGHHTKRIWFICGIATLLLVGSCTTLYVTSPFARTLIDANCYRNYHVPTAAMEPSVMSGDRIRANLCAYTDEAKPQVGDIIVFRYPKDPNISYVKRVVGVPGDRIQIADHVLIRNDLAVKLASAQNPTRLLDTIGDDASIKKLQVETLNGKRHFIMNNTTQSFFTKPDWPEDGKAQTVGDNEVYVMGDNRDNSSDSRVWGGVPLENVQGKVEYIVWSSSEKSLRTERSFELIDTIGL